MKSLKVLILFLMVAVVGLNAQADDDDDDDDHKVPSVARTCVGCHGEKGISPNGIWPNLAGQKEQYIEEQLKAFRSGKRQNEIMAPMAKMLDDDDIEKLAKFFSSLEDD